MQPGEVLGGRFLLERRTAVGGMGEVYRARDLENSTIVAVKVLLEGHASADQRRFSREAQVLGELSHPGIVRYVAHGFAAEDRPYLVMEWLDGEDLSRRLRRAPLSVEAAVLLGIRVSEALACAHARGVVHRDLKPSNLFLVGGDVGAVKVLDFGIAQVSEATLVTKTGVVLGTPGYIAPEQARSGQPTDARADVFALGCVLYRCLAGVPVWSGDKLVIVLAKVLFEEAPRVREHRPEVPVALDALIAKMLAKEPDMRPSSAMAVAAALKALGTGALVSLIEEPPLSSAPPSALTGSERRVVSVVLLGPGAEMPDATAPTRVEASPRPDWALPDQTLSEVVRAHGGRMERLADGSALVLVSSPRRVATDQATQAARCALAIRAEARDRPMALATGRVEITGVLPAGDAIERAERILESFHADVEDASGLAALPIPIDDVTAGLLDACFDVVEAPSGFALRGEREIGKGSRTLLGKATSCVGRDAELSALLALFEECVGEPVARAMLITAPAGIGKSRLAQELVRRIKQRGEPVTVWTGRCDSLRAGSSFALIGQVLRSALGIQDGEPASDRRQKIKARVAEHVTKEEQEALAEFLGELVGTPFPDEASPKLRAARQDALLMGEHLQRAAVSFLRAECDAKPIVMVLEDVHWGDLPTVRIIDRALRDMADEPLFVLALARPEVHELFPKLWADRNIQEMRLPCLTRKASERLVRQAFGGRVGKETIERILQRAEGHAFYLEELIRAVAQGGRASLPETVLAMVEARLAGLDDEARRVLRAASVFGETFWVGGVVRLLGGREQSGKARELLSELVEQELLIAQTESRFAGEPELSFRQALLREGAYAMLTEADRVLGHQLAALWLTEHGESDPMVLAEHHDRGEDSARAAEFYLRAAEQAQRGGDTDSAMARAERGLLGDVPAASRLALLGLLCEGHLWQREWIKGVPYAEEVLSLSTPGSIPWARAAMVKLGHALHHGGLSAVMTTVSTLKEAKPVPDAGGPVANAMTMAVNVSYNTGHLSLAAEILTRIEDVVAPVRERDSLARGWLDMARSYCAHMLREDPLSGVRFARAARASFTELGHRRGILFAQVFLGMNLWFLGAHAEAEEELLGAIVMDSKFGLVSGTFFLAEVLSDRGAFADARLVAVRLIEDARGRGAPLDGGRGHLALAGALRNMGDLPAAEAEVITAGEGLSILPMEQLSATATLASIRLAQGRAAEALPLAEQALGGYEAMGGVGHKGSFLRLVHAEALHAVGREGEARAAIAAAEARLLAMAEKIGDPAYRQSFLEKVPENARTRELSRAWGVEDGLGTASR